MRLRQAIIAKDKQNLPIKKLSIRTVVDFKKFKRISGYLEPEY